jgi:hypothetical protein
VQSLLPHELWRLQQHLSAPERTCLLGLAGCMAFAAPPPLRRLMRGHLQPLFASDIFAFANIATTNYFLHHCLYCCQTSPARLQLITCKQFACLSPFCLCLRDTMTSICAPPSVPLPSRICMLTENYRNCDGQDSINLFRAFFFFNGLFISSRAIFFFCFSCKMGRC